MNRKKHKLIFFIIYIAVIAVVVILQLFSGKAGILYSFDNTLKDALYQKGSLVNPNIYIIGIDEETLSEYGDYDTWLRGKLADLINLLSEDEENAPAVIGINIGLYNQKEAGSDNALAEAIGNAGNVVLNSGIGFDNTAGDGNNSLSVNPTAPIQLEEPYDSLKKAVLATGHSNIYLDEDGYVRHALGTVNFNGQEINSFAYEVAKAYLGTEPDSKYKSKSFYINYTGKPRDYYGTYGAGASFSKVLSGEYPTSAFKDSIVLIGAYASGLPDFYYTPIDHSVQMYGIEINANIIDQMLKGSYKYEVSLSVQVLITLLLGLLLAVLHTLCRLRYSLSANIVLFGAYVGAASITYKFDTVLPLFFPLLVIILLAAFGITMNTISETMARRAITTKYSKYLSPEIASAITVENDIQLGGTQKDIAVLFVDIRGFTSLAEKMAPNEIVSMLNKYFSLTSTAVFNHKGTIDKFIGDSIMAIFNAPLDMDDYEYQAVLAAIEMQETAANSNDKTFQQFLQFGIGINCGNAIVGNIGTDFRMEYTAVGDVVNTASRIEGQAGSGEIIVSEEVYNRLRYRIDFENIGERQLRGKTYGQTLYKVTGIKQKKQDMVF